MTPLDSQSQFVATDAGNFGFAYDAVAGGNRRKPLTTILRSEDRELLPADRQKLVAGTRDVGRNYAIAAWMVRRHLDYVSSFAFQSKSGDDALDEKVEALVAEWSKPKNFDAARRHGLRKFIRQAEARRVFDGDVFIVKLANGTVQAVEGDRCRSLAGDAAISDSLAHGVHLDKAGGAIGYDFWKRTGFNGFEYERTVSAQNVYQHAYFERFDQCRGISPLASALNGLRDCYEAAEYALAKMKLAQIFGLVIKSEEPNNPDTAFDFTSGPVKLEIQATEAAEILESKTPSTEFQSFMRTTIAVALKALDIPFSFFDESFSTYSGQRHAILQYHLAARERRFDNQLLLEDLFQWKVRLWVVEGKLTQAEADKVRGVWVPNGLSWIDPLKEIQANIAAIESGLDSRTNILKEQGRDFYEVADELADETAYLLLKKVPIKNPNPTSPAKPADGNEPPKLDDNGDPKTDG